MNTFFRDLPYKLLAVFAWLILSLALAGWWLLYGLRQVDKLSILQNESAGEILKQHRMLVSEGGTLFVLLLVGGVSLLYYITFEIRRAKQIQNFFAAFTHDLKTSLASLRLQAEALQEEVGQPSKLMSRLVLDTVRLELQLNNSLILAQDNDNKMFLQELNFREVISHLSFHWPDFKIEIDGDAALKADARAVESIFKNIIQNAIIHGSAQKMKLVCRKSEEGEVRIECIDDGRGFQGNERDLAKLFRRHSSSSGSGIGLYLVKTLSERMGGSAEFVVDKGGFTVIVTLPGNLK